MKHVCVSVYRTSVANQVQVNQLTSYLNKLAGKGNWNFALDDCDRILRIASGSIAPEATIKLLKDFGYSCSELED